MLKATLFIGQGQKPLYIFLWEALAPNAENQILHPCHSHLHGLGRATDM